MFIAALALLVAIGSNVTTYRLATEQTHLVEIQAEKNTKALCSIIDDSYAGALRRKKVLAAADKIKALEVSLPPGVAHDAVQVIEQVFRASGTGNAAARKALNKELAYLGCKTRVE